MSALFDGAVDRQPPDSNVVTLWGACPWGDDVTEYDKRNLCLYGLLIDAELEGASAFDMAWCFFHIHPNRRPDRALRVVKTHLARAYWLKENFFPYLNW
jgi:hypothetical protein